MSLIFKKIPMIMSAVGSISKERKNAAQGYSFRGIEDMYNAIHPVLVANGVFCVPSVLEFQTTEIEGTNANGGVKISYRTMAKVQHRFYAEDGSHVDVVTLGEGIDTSDKASNKAMSAAMKYAFIELLSIPTEDIEDSDRESPDAGRSSREPVAKTNPAPTPSAGPRLAPIQNHGPRPGVTPASIKAPAPDTGDGSPVRTEYRITFGKWVGRSIEQVCRDQGPREVADYIRYLESKPPISPGVRTFIDNASDYLAKSENDIDVGMVR